MNQEDFLDGILKEQAKFERKKQAIAWGKLGGRPLKQKQKKSEKLLLSLTEEQLQKLEVKAKKYKLSPQDYLRHYIEQDREPDLERMAKVRLLIEYRTNFARLSNYLKKEIWTADEKEKFKNELNDVVKLIERTLKEK